MYIYYKFMEFQYLEKKKMYAILKVGVQSYVYIGENTCVCVRVWLQTLSEKITKLCVGVY